MSVIPQGIIIKTADYSVTTKEAEGTRVFTNEGAGALVTFTLPSAQAGYRTRFIVQDDNGIQVDAGAGDTINGVASLSSLNVGDIIDVYCINTTEWVGVITNQTSNQAGGTGSIGVTTGSGNAGENITTGDAVVRDQGTGDIYRGDATNGNRIGFVGIATNTVTTGNTVNYTSKGDINITGTVSDTQYFLSTTPGAISTTLVVRPDFPVVIGRGVATDILRLDINTVQPGFDYDAPLFASGVRYYAGVAGNITAFQGVSGATTSGISIFIGLTTAGGFSVAESTSNFAGARLNSSFVVPAGYYRRVILSSTGGAIDTQRIRFTPIN